jgi:hypothetical protein
VRLAERLRRHRALAAFAAGPSSPWWRWPPSATWSSPPAPLGPCPGPGPLARPRARGADLPGDRPGHPARGDAGGPPAPGRRLGRRDDRRAGRGDRAAPGGGPGPRDAAVARRDAAHRRGRAGGAGGPGRPRRPARGAGRPAGASTHLDLALTGGVARYGGAGVEFDLVLRKGREGATAELTLRSGAGVPLVLTADARMEGPTVRVRLTGRGELGPVAGWLPPSAGALASRPLSLTLDVGLAATASVSARGGLALGDVLRVDGEGTLRDGTIRVASAHLDVDLGVAGALAGLGWRPAGRAELSDVTLTWRPEGERHDRRRLAPGRAPRAAGGRRRDGRRRGGRRRPADARAGGGRPGGARGGAGRPARGGRARGRPDRDALPAEPDRPRGRVPGRPRRARPAGGGRGARRLPRLGRGGQSPRRPARRRERGGGRADPASGPGLARRHGPGPRIGTPGDRPGARAGHLGRGRSGSRRGLAIMRPDGEGLVGTRRAGDPGRGGSRRAPRPRGLGALPCSGAWSPGWSRRPTSRSPAGVPEVAGATLAARDRGRRRAARRGAPSASRRPWGDGLDVRAGDLTTCAGCGRTSSAGRARRASTSSCGPGLGRRRPAGPPGVGGGASGRSRLLRDVVADLPLRRGTEGRAAPWAGSRSAS